MSTVSGGRDFLPEKKQKQELFFVELL